MIRRLFPLFLLLAIVIPCALLIQDSDHLSIFAPVGHALLSGQDPYHAAAPFLYWPFTLPAFAVLALTPPLALLAINVLCLLRVINHLKLSLWVLMCPYVIYALMAGQLDCIALALAVEAYKSKRTLPMLLAVMIKPQIALFWILPWITREKALRLALPLAVIGALIPPTLWQGWLTQTQLYGATYLNATPGFWSIGLPLLAVLALVGWLMVGRDPRGKSLLALGLPALRYYSAVALIDAAPVGVLLAASWGTLAAILATGWPLGWLAPAGMAGYGLAQGRIQIPALRIHLPHRSFAEATH